MSFYDDNYRHDAWKDSYDAWKLASPDDERDDECFHEDYEADVNGRAHCCRCSHSWWLTDDEIAAERAHVAAYDEYCRKHERREFWRKLTHPIRWPIYRLLERVWPRKSCAVLYDDEIPF